MELLRTPDEAFADLPGYPFAPHYVEVPTGDGDQLVWTYGPMFTARLERVG
ncbi:MAG TPA: hypothetical protein VFP02_00050 [Acidimicrobiales bacterium]|nr:hypothetical protein [Acidimicrobiales bacterium]